MSNCYTCGKGSGVFGGGTPFYCRKCHVVFCPHCAATYIHEEHGFMGGSVYWECPNCSEKQAANSKLVSMKRSGQLP